MSFRLRFALFYIGRSVPLTWDFRGLPIKQSPLRSPSVPTASPLDSASGDIEYQLAMDYRRAASPPSTSIPSRSHAYSHYRSPNRTPHHSPHASRSYAGGAAPMSIPNSSRASSPPPPLPPPTFLSDIAEGRDLAWDHLNTPWKAELQHRPTSPHLERGSRRNNSGYDEGYFEPSESRRRNDSTTMVTSLPGVEGFDRPPHGDEGYGSLSGSSLAQSVLHLLCFSPSRSGQAL